MKKNKKYPILMLYPLLLILASCDTPSFLNFTLFGNSGTSELNPPPSPTDNRFFTGIRIFELPSKTTYYIDEPLDLTGLVLYVTYNDGSSIYVTSYFITIIGGFDSSTPGNKTVIIGYTESLVTITTTFTVTVVSLNGGMGGMGPP